MARFGMVDVALGAALSMVTPTEAHALEKAPPIGGEAVASGPATPNAPTSAAPGVGAPIKRDKLVRLGEGVPTASKATKRREETEQRDDCARAGVQINTAVYRALDNDHHIRGVLSYFARAAQKMTENQCLEDHGLKPKK